MAVRVLPPKGSRILQPITTALAATPYRFYPGYLYRADIEK
jgi:hypothetical protein